MTLLVGLSLTAAFAAVAVGQLNLLSVAFVVLNVGLGSDYVIHVLLRYRELAAEGHATHGRARRATMRGVGSSLVLCAVTTAAGFYSFIPTTFSGVSELGLIAGTGVFFGLFVSVTLLPALVAWWGDRAAAARRGDLDRPAFFAPLARRPRARARRHGRRARRQRSRCCRASRSTAIRSTCAIRNSESVTHAARARGSR